MENKSIDPEDLELLEEDLSHDELISILFLLYGAEKSSWIVEKLEKPSIKNFLHDYAINHKNWKTTIIEALTITNLFEVIECLGVDSSEAREHLSRSPTINPALILLYQLCEACTKNTTNKLILSIKKVCRSANFVNETLLEVFLLHCISCQVIKISPIVDECDFSFITNIFNHNEVDEVKDVLEKFPKRSNSFVHIKCKPFENLKSISPASSKTASSIEEYASKELQVLIINQQTFFRETNQELQGMLPKDELNERRGTGKDKEALKFLFENFGYAVTVKNNLTHSEMLEEIDKASKKASEADGIIVCILSHGHEGIVYGHNSIPVRVKDIKKIMATKLLLGKSKILLIQACQGDDFQQSVKKFIPKTELDGPSRLTEMSDSVYADFLIFWSTIEGFASVRHIDDGSWFIQELVKKIRDLHGDKHLLDICTSVIRAVSLKRSYENECMLPKFETTFKKNFRFPEFKNNSTC